MRTRSLGKIMAIAATAVTMGAFPASAQISYTTSGVFGGAAGTCNTNSCTMGTVTITFNGGSGVNVLAPSNIGLGTFTTTGTTGSGTFNVPFTITVNQTDPSSGSGSFAPGTLAGTVTITTTGSGSMAVFTPAPGSSVEIGLVRYEFDQEFYRIIPPSSESGVTVPGTTTIQGVVSVVPEPSSVLLMASGLAGLGLFGLRARRRAQKEN